LRDHGTGELSRDPDTLAKLEPRVALSVPSGRISEAVGIANTILFLASDESSWVTGSTVTVDGGYLAI